MNILEVINDELYNKVLTENGDVAYKTTGSHCLDYFVAIGGLRNNPNKAFELFLKAYREDPHLALKILFYSRDILGGLGQRYTFRLTLNIIANFYPEIAKQLIPYIVKYGRYDDLLSYLMTASQTYALDEIKKQLDEDIENKKQNKPISLLPKWLPSINTSNADARKKAQLIAQKIGMDYETYRKTLSFLRKGVIIENALREKDYSFDYNKVPSQALFKYSKAFARNDKERYNAFIQSDDTHINTKTLAPYQVVTQAMTHEGDANVLNKTWAGFERKEFDSKTIVVLDGSGSMYLGQPSYEAVGISIALLFAEQLKGEFHNTFITFSSRPQLVHLPSSALTRNVKECLRHTEAANTDIEAVYDLLYNVAKSKKLSQDEMIERIVIVSDMEFDKGTENVPTFETFKHKFEAIGLKLPEIVYWNVAMRTIHFPVSQDERFIKLVSGFSQHVIDDIMTNNTQTPMEFMLASVERYSELDNIIV